MAARGDVSRIGANQEKIRARAEGSCLASLFLRPGFPKPLPRPRGFHCYLSAILSGLEGKRIVKTQREHEIGFNRAENAWEACKHCLG